MWSCKRRLRLSVSREPHYTSYHGVLAVAVAASNGSDDHARYWEVLFLCFDNSCPVTVSTIPPCFALQVLPGHQQPSLNHHQQTRHSSLAQLATRTTTAVVGIFMGAPKHGGGGGGDDADDIAENGVIARQR